MNRFNKYIVAQCILVCCLMLCLSVKTTAQTNINFKIEGATISEKDIFIVAFKAETLLTGKGILSFRFGISYNANFLEFLNIDSVGIVLKDWGIPSFNNKTNGKIIIAGAGSTPLVGNGNMIYLKFKALNSGTFYLENIDSEGLINEGFLKLDIAGERIRINPRSYPLISPNSGQLFIGDELQMSVSGGVSPYVYASEDTAVAVISNQTNIKAKSPGTTRVFVTDKDGEISYTTGFIDVRAIKINVIRSSAWPQETFSLPIKIEIAPGTKIYSGYFELTNTGNVQAIKESVTIADFDISIQNNVAGNITRVSFATAQGITGSGLLCYLNFKAINSGNHSFGLQNLRFNENLLAFAYNEYVQVYNLPSLTITPNSKTLMWGTTEKITISNGTPPYSYQVSNPLLGTIDALGNLTGLSGGKLNIIVTDSHGATKTSGEFTIIDNNFSIVNSDGVLDRTTYVPVSSSLLPPGKSIYDFEGTISFNENELEFIGIKEINDEMLTQFVKTGNSVHFVGATSSPIQSGIICFLMFKINNSVALDQQLNISLTSLKGNEGSLISGLSSGKITRVTQLAYRPIAVAGLNKSVREGDVVQLDGSESYDEDREAITYLWESPIGIQLNDNTLKKPSFTAPNVNSNTNYTFQLIVNDGTSNSDPSYVTITVLHINQRPIANAGPDKNYIEGSSVSLNGSISSDPDNDPIAYSWTSIDGIPLFNSNSAFPLFIAPQVNFDKDYRFKLEVSDGIITSIADTVSIKVVQLNKKPFAFAGGDQTINEAVQVQLDGSLSSDPDNEVITFKWIAPSIVTLSSTTVSKPTFIAPFVHRDSLIIISLVINDGRLNSDTDRVSIRIRNLNILSTEAQVLNCSVPLSEDIDIDHITSQIVIYLPYGTDVTSLAPTFALSPKSSIYPLSGTSRNFIQPNTYTVTAEDAVTTKTYTVKVFVPTITMKRILNAGWNWISLSAIPNDLKLNSVLGSLSMTELDYLKSSTLSSVYYTNSGWFGDLINLPQFELLMLKKANTEIFTLTGKEINPTITTLPVSNGWNRIGYFMKGNADIADAFELASLPAGDILLKSKEASAIYYPGSGWVGDLDSLKVLNGYLMKTSGNGNIKFKATGAKLKSAQQLVFNRSELNSRYQLNPSEYEFSATMIAEIVDSAFRNNLGKGDLLIAYSNDKICGVTESSFVKSLNRYIFVLTFFSNSNTEKINFRKINVNDQTEILLSEELDFKANEIFGRAMQPFQLHPVISTRFSENLKDISVKLFPNPVINELAIISDDLIQTITLSEISGKVVKQLSSVARNSLQLDTRNLDKGIYIIKIKTSKGTVIHKLFKSGEGM